MRPACDPSPAIDDSKNYPGDVWTYTCFCHNFSDNYPQAIKNNLFLEKHATRLFTICPKNQALN
jgi:hypothetical protein